MEDDLIVVDDEPTQVTPHTVNPQSFYGRSAASTIADSVRSRRRSTPEVGGHVERATRSSFKPKAQPKLKLKLSDKATIVSGTSFLGPYDRELDSDDEDLSFEEQFILRMPPGEDCDRLRKMVAAREASNDVWFKFKDSRRAVFHIGNNNYSAKLVDLPCIIEAQKTLDNKQMFKVADICQMLVVDNKVDSEDGATKEKNFNIDDFIWPHGITPPLHHVRKRRFRKRVNRRTIETVEQEVERLLETDQQASKVEYVVLENVNPDLSDSEFIEMGMEPAVAETPGGLSDGGEGRPGEAMDGGSDDEEQEGDIDEELAAELDLALGDEGDDDEGDEDDEDQSDEDDDDEDEEDDETSQSKRLLNEEIRDLEAAVAKKGHEIASSANPLIKRRFEDALKKLQADLEMKLTQRAELDEQQRMRKEGVPQRENSEANDDDDDGDTGMDLD